MRSEDLANGLKGHLVILTLPAWGCLKSLCGIANTAVRESPDIIVTFLTLGAWDEKILVELDRYNRQSDLEEQKEEMRLRIRLVNIGGQGFGVPDLMSIAINSFPDYYRKLVQGESVRSLSTGQDTLRTIPPTVVITEYLYSDILQDIRRITGKDVAVWNWWSSGTYVLLRSFGPKRYGGLGGAEDVARRVVEDTGRDVEDVMKELTNMKQGDVVALPGLPPFHDYEWYPIPEDWYKELPVSFYEINRKGTRFMAECEAFMFDTCSGYESEAITATREWLESTGGRKVYAVGPMSPWIAGLKDNTSEVVGHGAKDSDASIRAFLDKILASHGQKSLLYLSFGSMWWPRSDFIRLWIEILLEEKVPFLFAIASPYADLPDELIDRISRSEIAMVSKWCPQQMILNHPATGWFLSHCGHNSVTESLSRGVPIIAWPLMFDQPGTAAYISLSLDAAFELTQVRTGIEGLKPLHRDGESPVGTLEAVGVEARDILRRMKGEEGAQKRRIAERVKDEIREAWMKDGDALEDFRQLLSDAMKKGN